MITSDSGAPRFPTRIMPSLHHGTIFIGVFLIVTGGSTAFLGSNQNKMQVFSLSCVVMGAILLILGLFWSMRTKNPSGTIVNSYGQVLFTPPGGGMDWNGSPLPESQAVMLRRTLERMHHPNYPENEVDYPPLDPRTCMAGRHPHWDMDQPPPYEMAIKTTKSSTHLRRCCSDSQLPTEPLFGASREVSFEV
ncbi:uncharacterized protein LOC136714774 [Amia ocellicauda]|uniref:uncharacterized protein LOC136714774 n=1 Tax=Amia ocellicauda TaxID=2972642 RepID=UPI003464029D